MKPFNLILFIGYSLLVLSWQCKKSQPDIETVNWRASKKTPANAALNASVMYTNPLQSIDNGSYYDPWVIHIGGYYYYCGSDGGRLWITQSATLENLLQKTKTYIFTPPGGTAWSHNLWAPELHYLNGRWYVYFAADNGTNDNHRMYVLEGGSNASNPLDGSYGMKAKLCAVIGQWIL